MRVIPLGLSLVLFISLASSQVPPLGVAPDSKGKIVIKGRTFGGDYGTHESQVIAKGADVTYEGCRFVPKKGYVQMSVKGSVIFRGCLFDFRTWGTITFTPLEGGSIAFEECIITARLLQLAGLQKAKLTARRCRIDADELHASGDAISFVQCDLERVKKMDAGDGQMFTGSGKQDIRLNAKGCWWGSDATAASVKARIRDATVGYVPAMGSRPTWVTVDFLPLAKAPFTTKLKPPEEKPSPEKKSDSPKKK